MNTQIVWVNPRARVAFNLLIITGMVLLSWFLVFACFWGGGFWVAAAITLGAILVVYGLGEWSGAYEEKIVRVDDNAAT